MSRPLLIVLTPVRNEAWILHAFLKATSLWADHIIIADQMSTDGSRDIYPLYDKVIVIDNSREEMHQARTRKLLFEAAQKIEGDKILFALDADEFLSGNFVNTPSWQTILGSKPGDVFSFRWMNLLPGCQTYTSFKPYYWAVHVDEDVFNGEFPDNHIHEWRLPWSNHVNNEYIIEDISFIHFARVNEQRQTNKEIFYQVATANKKHGFSGIQLYRHYQTYHPITEDEILEVPNDAFIYYTNNNVNIIQEIEFDDIGQHYLDNVLEKINEKGFKHFAKLDIWDNDFVKKYDLKNPQSCLDKAIISYLRFTKKWTKTFFIKGIDYLLKKFY